MTDIKSDQLAGSELRVWSASIEDPKFGEQVEPIKSSGADFDGRSKTWRLPLRLALDGDEPGLDTLFKAAREYGAVVVLARRETSS